MTDPSRPFQLAVNALAAAALPLAQIHYGGVKVADTALTYPYLVQWPIAALGVPANLTGNLIPAVNEVRWVACGRDVDEVITALDRLGAALRGKRPVIEGWLCNQIREVPTMQPVGENTEILFNGRPTYRGWAHYRMGAEPAAVIGS
jgi:hypothetical protein